MTIKEELIKYAHNCIGDVYVSEYEDYISGKKHKQACQRFLDDLEKDWEYYWDEEEAEKIVKWFSYLKHSKGILAGQPIHLTTWQKFIMCQLYGWRHKETGNKRFKIGFVEVGRKNAKSQMQAGSMLYEMSVQATKNNEVYETYCAGTKRDQSKIIFNEAKLMLRGSLLAPKFKLTNNIITHTKSGSFLKALSKEDGKKGDGTNPAVLVLDEYHQHQTTEFYDLFIGSDVKEGLMMIITTAGVDLSYPCYTNEYTYVSNLLNPNLEVINDEYFADICEIDKEDKNNFNDKRIWKKANPIRTSYKEGMERIKMTHKVAVEVPEKMISFRTKILNEWVQAKDMGYMDMDKWKDCEVKEIPFEWQNQDVYVGFDMSSKIDLTSVSFVIPVMIDEVAKYTIFTHSFIPNREKLIERTHLDKVPYDAWEEAGYLTVTNTPIVDQTQVMNYVMKFCEENNLEIQTLCFDPANSSKLMLDAENEGNECVEVYQSYKSLNESTNGFREQVFSGNVYYLRNPLLTFAMGNTVIRQNNGLIKIDKDATKKKIDPIDAILCGYKLAMYHEFVNDMSKYLEDEYLDKLYG